MALDTVTLQGRFTADGNDVTIPLRGGVTNMAVYNETQMAATNDVGLYYKWYQGQVAGGGFKWTGADGDNHVVAGVLAGTGFTLVDTGVGQTAGSKVAVASISNAVQPIVATGVTTGLVAGNVVRLVNVPATTNVPNVCGIDFEIDTVVNATSFRIAEALANAPGGVGGASFYRKVNSDPIFYPRRRFVVKITQAAQAVVSVSVTHNYVVGQQVRFEVPEVFGMTQLDKLTGNIVAVTARTFTVDIDTTAFNAFVYPLAASYAFTFAQVFPFGETAEAPYANLLDDATVNTAIIGMKLGGGAGNPGGANGDVMYWEATQSFSVDNQ